jgi:hypothetical protein
MKHKIRSLEDIYREKQKMQKEIAVYEYALKLHTKEIRNKLSFVSLSAYVFSLMKKQLMARMPGMMSGILKGILATWNKSKSR